MIGLASAASVGLVACHCPSLYGCRSIVEIWIRIFAIGDITGHIEIVTRPIDIVDAERDLTIAITRTAQRQAGRCATYPYVETNTWHRIS